MLKHARYWDSFAILRARNAAAPMTLRMVVDAPAYSTSVTISASATPPRTTRRASVTAPPNLAAPAAPGFTTNVVPRRVTRALCVWPYTITSAAYASASLPGVGLPSS